MKYCAKCSSVIADSDTLCPNCGAAIEEAANASGTGQNQNGFGQASPGSSQASSNYDSPPPKYTTQAVLLILFCCWPLAIPVLVYSSKIDKLFYQGRKEEAWQASKNAKTWCIVSLVSGIVYFVIVGIVALVVSLAANHGY